MSHPDRRAVAAALELLANSEDYSQLKQDVIKLAYVQHGGFVGRFDPLNVLVEWARETDPKRLQPLWDLADRKHVQVYPSARKATYQATYMSQRRQRLAQATKLYERLHGVRLERDARDRFRKAMQTVWMMQRDEIAHGTPPGNERNEIVRAFWEDIEQQLERGLAGDEAAARTVLGEAKP